jgi:uncharacterized protein (DUF427 family)
MFTPARIQPAPGQESVWDYPRPPKLEPVAKRLRVVFNGETIADTVRSFRILETSHPPVYYIAPDDIVMSFMVKAQGSSWCEFKGHAVYWTLNVRDRRAENAGWSYPRPSPAFAAIADHVAFYASRVDEAYVGDERVQAQQGDFYGGWITSDIVGPFKGAPGTRGW